MALGMEADHGLFTPLGVGYSGKQPKTKLLNKNSSIKDLLGEITLAMKYVSVRLAD